MCPCPISAWILWKNKGIFPTKELEDWLKLNPYDLRVQGLSQKLKLSELGRVLYHLAQRRGKLVSKLNDHNKDKSIFMNGDPKTKRLGLYATQKQHKKGESPFACRKVYETHRQTSFCQDIGFESVHLTF